MVSNLHFSPWTPLVFFSFILSFCSFHRLSKAFDVNGILFLVPPPPKRQLLIRCFCLRVIDFDLSKVQSIQLVAR